MVLPETISAVDQTQTAGTLRSQGFVGALLVVLIGLNAYAIVWRLPETVKQIAADSRADMRNALTESDERHTRAMEAVGGAFTKEQDRLERLLGEKPIDGNPIAGARP